MSVWLAVLAYALPPVLLVLQRLRAPRDLASRQRVAQTVLTFLAVPVAWAGVSFLSNALLTRMGPTGAGGLAAALLAPALLLLLIVLIAQRVPWARVWPLGLVPILLWFGISRIGGSHVVEAGSIRILLAAAMLLAAAAIAGPAAAGALARSEAPRVGFAAVMAALLLVPASSGILMPLIGLTEGGLGSAASQSWEITFVPEGDEPYVLVVPFFIVEGGARPPPNTEMILDRLRDEMRIMGGNATLSLVDEGRAVELRGRGFVQVAASFEFYGPGTESFLHYRLPADDNVTLAEGSPSGRLRFEASFSGGSGHTCRSRVHHELVVAPEAPVSLRTSESTDWGYGSFSSDGRLSALCA